MNISAFSVAPRNHLASGLLAGSRTSFAVRDGEATQGGVYDQAHAPVGVVFGSAAQLLPPQSRDLFIPVGAETLEAQSVVQVRAWLIAFLFANPQSGHYPVQPASSTPGIPAFLNELDRNVSDGLEAHLIADNHAVHKHPRVNARLARHPRFHIHYTAYASWLNQVERWFGLIIQRASGAGRFVPLFSTRAKSSAINFGRALSGISPRMIRRVTRETHAVIIDQCLKGDHPPLRRATVAGLGRAF
jgi:hypothetical protein